jgi:hypothetical protein
MHPSSNTVRSRVMRLFVLWYVVWIVYLYVYIVQHTAAPTTSTITNTVTSTPSTITPTFSRTLSRLNGGGGGGAKMRSHRTGQGRTGPDFELQLLVCVAVPTMFGLKGKRYDHVRIDG